MHKFAGIIFVSLVALAGCVQKKPTQTAVKSPVQVQQNSTAAQPMLSSDENEASNSGAMEDGAFNSNAEYIQQCRKELDAIRLYNAASYNSYLAEFQKVGRETQKYLAVKNAIGSDINNLVMPHYQFQIRELCFRVKTRLAQLMISQIK
ncbi:hypothetical protein [Pantoea sp.]|uniref:hypothetical protein n=1 Tax=Pantoea sp. TaxID=69393 RepID=UPI002896F446|nr:hypothetical protein [Pantoea sp.]